MANSVYDRRAFMAYFSSIGLGASLLPGVLWARQAQQGTPITKEDVAAAEEIAGVSFTDEQREEIARSLRQTRGAIEQLQKVSLDMSVPPAIIFDPLPPGESLPPKHEAPTVRSRVAVMARPGSLDELAYAPVTQLSEMVRTRKVKPSELTAMYLSRLQRYDSQLHFVVNLTEERARTQAKQLDAEVAHGHYRGPLHGIPWGAKDLLAVKGYPTTWGAAPYRNQMLDYDATVVKRLDDAGAVLVAKLTLGALAQGDIWFGERTRNPWNPETGSSGSSAGPASATAAGCVGFSIGSETNGSITSPSRTCGVSGFRPTFGRVPRTGAMALAWTMDKLGPICRSAEDCALVFDAIQGPDNLDLSVRKYPFNWNANAKLSSLRIAYVASAFEGKRQDGTPFRNEQALDVLKVLEGLGAKLTPIEQPTPSYAFLASLILAAEAGAAFQEPALAGKLDEMERGRARFYSTWPGYFRTAQFEPAVDYVNANRARTLQAQQWWKLFQEHDVILTPQENTSITNVTGTPSIVVPTGFAVPRPFDRGRRGPSSPAEDTARAGYVPPVPTPPRSTTPLPTWIYIMGPLYQDEKILTVAHAFQRATDFHSKHPPLFA